MSFKPALALSDSKANNNSFANIEIEETFDSLVTLFELTHHFCFKT
jgi:hypothetical protein